MAFVNAVPLSTAARPAFSHCAVRPAARTAFAGARVAAHLPVARAAVRMEFEISEGVSFEINPVILGLAIVGWVVPSSLPSGIALTEGTGLTQAFIASMNANLANFPKGPAGDDPFWLLMFLWHVGLFACMIFGTIGWNSRRATE